MFHFILSNTGEFDFEDFLTVLLWWIQNPLGMFQENLLPFQILIYPLRVLVGRLVLLILFTSDFKYYFRTRGRVRLHLSLQIAHESIENRWSVNP